MSTFIVRLFPTPPPFDIPAKPHAPDLSELNERQRKAIEFIQQHGGITVMQLVTIVGVTERPGFAWDDPQLSLTARQLIE